MAGEDNIPGLIEWATIRSLTVVSSVSDEDPVAISGGSGKLATADATDKRDETPAIVSISGSMFYRFLKRCRDRERRQWYIDALSGFMPSPTSFVDEKTGREVTEDHK